LGALASVWSMLNIHWQVLGTALGVIALGDGMILLARRKLSVERTVSERLALGVDSEVTLTVRNEGFSSAEVEVFDGIPKGSEVSELPWRGRVPAKGYTVITYSIRLYRRGPVQFTQTHLLR